MFHVVPDRAHDLSRWRLFVAQEVKVSGVLDEIIIWPDLLNFWGFLIFSREKFTPGTNKPFFFRVYWTAFVR